jgi:tRNA(Ile)-lysidine synthetase-like protein
MKNNNIYHPISFELSEELRKIVISKKPNIISTINENVFFVKSYSHCYFTNDISGHLFSFEINKPTIIDNEFFFLDLTGDTSNRKISEDSYPFVIRSAKPDDVYEIKGYKKTFKRLFIDWKVPLELRGRYPVFEKNGKIFYTPRYQKDFKIDNFCNFYIK